MRPREQAVLGNTCLATVGARVTKPTKGKPQMDKLIVVGVAIASVLLGFAAVKQQNESREKTSNIAKKYKQVDAKTAYAAEK